MAPTLICRTATVFTADGAVDEDGLRHYLQRLIEQGHGLYLASGGSGEGHALSHAELRQVYAAGVACGRGKVPVYANPPEQHTAQLTLEHSLSLFFPLPRSTHGGFDRDKLLPRSRVVAAASRIS
jgi:hypothetical protein